MLKAILLAGALAAPVLAQTTAPEAQPANRTAPQSAPQPPSPATAAPDPAADTVEVKTGVPATPTPLPTPLATPAPPAAAAPKEELERKAQPTPPDSVAAVVDSEFPANDLNADGKLSRSEFAQWMVRLKAGTDAVARAAPATQAWVAGAWRTADRDRNAGVTAAELTRFLSRG